MVAFDRWTDRARRSVVLAQEHARMLNHTDIGTGHILAGLAAEGGSTAYQALAALGADPGSVRNELERIRRRGRTSPPGHIPFSQAAKRACEGALRESITAGVRYVGPEHILLALLRDEDGEAERILSALGISGGDVRAKVGELLAGYEQAGRPAVPPDARPDGEMRRVWDAFLAVHQAACEHCGLLSLLCPDCRNAVGECVVRRQIERLAAGEVPADGS